MTTTKDPLAMIKPGYGNRPPLPRYESEPVVYIEELNDSAAAGSELAKAFDAMNQRIAANAYRIFE